MKLARLLTNDEINDDTLASANGVLLGVINAEYKIVKKSTRFKQIVEERSQIEIEAVNWDVGSDATREGETVKVDIASENVEKLDADPFSGCLFIFRSRSGKARQSESSPMTAGILDCYEASFQSRFRW
jgi:hypothetical protein